MDRCTPECLIGSSRVLLSSPVSPHVTLTLRSCPISLLRRLHYVKWSIRHELYPGYRLLIAGRFVMLVQSTSAIQITDGAIVFPRDEGKNMNSPQVSLPSSCLDFIFQRLFLLSTCDTLHLENGGGKGCPAHHGSEVGEARP
jgi:hypothetical protein